MEYLITGISSFLIAFLAPYITQEYTNRKFHDIEKRIFRDLGDRIEITTSLGTWPFGPKTIRIRRESVELIQEAAVISLFLKNKGVIDLYFSGINSKEIAQEAGVVFPEAKRVVIPMH
ncbi:hypothetical protein Mag101_11890 [Microbulbifer agarilyticus]|uniref:Uncharacterized protein n=1 Tax=Microbulbifer agarilyticus TaxID=260552 RepID=A0A1Q2M6C3_9GAMM|nr:hypothetical protein [Microbulbifer agarilyticus]AQQ68264.1 hypothetical protein Mag101_11890 [Microbulbifer agarilyticus]